VPRGQRDGSLRPYSRLSRPNPLLFLPSSSSVVLTTLSGPRSRPTTVFLFFLSRKSGSVGKPTRASGSAEYKTSAKFIYQCFVTVTHLCTDGSSEEIQ
jgi:hypothetical protein